MSFVNKVKDKPGYFFMNKYFSAGNDPSFSGLIVGSGSDNTVLSAENSCNKMAISLFLKVLSVFPSLSGSLVNGCFGQASWLQIVMRVWEGCRLLSHSHGSLCFSEN